MTEPTPTPPTPPQPTRLEERGAAEWVAAGAAAVDAPAHIAHIAQGHKAAKPPPVAEAPKIELPPGVDR